jgi:hypothetical protein
MNGFIRTICESIGTPLLCLGYVARITMLFQNRALAIAVALVRAGLCRAANEAAPEVSGA